MESTEHGIGGSRAVENMHHMRLMALLQELVREKGYKGAARVLEIDPQTVTNSAKTGQLTRRVRDALDRALQEGVGSAAARQRERNDRLEQRLDALEKGHESLGKEVRRRLAAVEGGLGERRRDEPQGAGPAEAEEPKNGASAPGRRPPSRPSMRREYPDLVTREPADDDEEIFGDAFPLVVEWRELKESHPTRGWGLAWHVEHERLLALELELLEEHGMTLPPEKQPLRGFDRGGQVNWRRSALSDTRRARARWELFHRVRRAATLVSMLS